MTGPNSVATNYTYDNLSRLLSVLHQISGSTIDGASYTLDSAGNRTAKTDQLAAVTSNYAYDAIYQLTQAATTTESFSYDPVGNRTASLGVSSYTTNASNELTATPGVSYTYDSNGNTLTKVVGSNTTSYAWDYENRLTSVTLPGSGGTVSFKYDPFGRRIEKISPTTTSIFAYDGPNLIDTVNSTGGVVARYTQTQNVDEPLAESRSGTTSYYEADGLGSVTSLSNTSGALAQTYTYDSFGNTTSSSGSLTNFFRYTGREFDTETDLYSYRARYYDSNAGRFLSEDPEMFEAGVNFYVYALENPVAFRDPYGFDIWLEGPSGNEPAGHLSINVGDPNGAYSSYGFGVDGNGLEGMVYQDISHGGDFYPGDYLHTTPAEDALAKAHLDSLLGNTAGYRPWNTCRTFSFNQFKYFQDKGFGKPGPPPPRAKNPRNPSFHVPWYSSSTASDPVASSPTTSSPVSSNGH